MTHKITLKEEDYDLDFLSTADGDFGESVVRLPYKILIADDDNEMHIATKVLLRDFKFEGRPIVFFDAYSGKETLERLEEHPDTAVLFLDVVMEAHDSGLRVVDQIRHSLGNKMVRIILRTGQPGEAPEERIMADYDINDYRLKTDLTVQRLHTTLHEALRAYRDIQKVEMQRLNLERVIHFSARLFEQPNQELFYQTLLSGMVLFKKHDDLMNHLECDSAVSPGYDGVIILEEPDQSKNVVATIGKFDTVNPTSVLEMLFPIKGEFEALGSESIRFAEVVTCSNGFMICKSIKNGDTNYIYIEESIDLFDMPLVKVFLTYYALALDNFIVQQKQIETCMKMERDHD